MNSPGGPDPASVLQNGKNKILSKTCSTVSRNICKYQSQKSIQEIKETGSDVDINANYLCILHVPDNFCLC